MSIVLARTHRFHPCLVPRGQERALNYWDESHRLELWVMWVLGIKATHVLTCWAISPAHPSFWGSCVTILTAILTKTVYKATDPGHHFFNFSPQTLSSEFLLSFMYFKNTPIETSLVSDVHNVYMCTCPMWMHTCMYTWAIEQEADIQCPPLSLCHICWDRVFHRTESALI